ncbi:MAG: hypothetical protein MK364_02385, partial [Pirellulales bacterium]|nr:hypothetical protein [Pirellulales bacterium]
LSALRDAQGRWHHKFKRSENGEKYTLPGILQVRRYYRNGAPHGDMLYDELTEQSSNAISMNGNAEHLVMDNSLETEDLLTPVMRAGTVVSSPPSLRKLQQRTQRQLAQFGITSWQHRDRSAAYHVTTERNFFNQTQKLLSAAKETTS